MATESTGPVNNQDQDEPRTPPPTREAVMPLARDQEGGGLGGLLDDQDQDEPRTPPPTRDAVMALPRDQEGGGPGRLLDDQPDSSDHSASSPD